MENQMKRVRRVIEWFNYVRTPRSYPARWQDRLFRGHVTFGPRWLNVTVYGANAMHWAINVRWRGEYWCFHPTTRTFGGYWRWKFYVSRDATPGSARIGFGPGFSR
jgi:hypothetical protein